jgi:hypothetical protein
LPESWKGATPRGRERQTARRTQGLTRGDHREYSQERFPKTKLVLQIVMTLATVGAFGAAAVYAWFAQQQVVAMNDTVAKTQSLVNEQTKATNAARTAADAAKRAASAAEKSNALTAQQMELAERPWVFASHEIETPLTFVPAGGAALVLRETMENVGRSAAVDLSSWADAIPLDPNGSAKSAIARQVQYCDAHRRYTGKGALGTSVLFPKQNRSQTIGMGPTREQLAQAVAKAQAMPGQPKRVGFAIVGCIWYRAFFEPEDTPLHQTRFMYYLARRYGPTEMTVSFLYSGIPAGMNAMVEPAGKPEGLLLIPWGEATSAD